MPPHESFDSNNRESLAGPASFYNMYVQQEADLYIAIAELELKRLAGYIFTGNVAVPVLIDGNHCYFPPGSPDANGRLVMMRDTERAKALLSEADMYGQHPVWMGPPDDESPKFDGLLEAEHRGLWVKRANSVTDIDWDF